MSASDALHDLLFSASIKRQTLKGTKLPRHRPGELFLKGPIPWVWLRLAAKSLPRGKVLHVAVVIWLLAYLQDSPTVKLSAERLRELGVDRYAGYRALAALKRAGLITVVHHPGRLPLVTLLDPPRPARAESIERTVGNP